MPDSGAQLDEQYVRDHREAMQYVDLSAGQFAFFSTYTPLPHGDRAMQELLTALRNAKDEIFLASWMLEPDLELTRTDWDQPRSVRWLNALNSVLLERAKAGVVVRGLIWNYLNLRFAPPTGSGSSAGGTTRPVSSIMRQVRHLAAALNGISPVNQLVVIEHPMPFATRTVLGVSFSLGGSHHQKIWVTRSGVDHTAFVGGVNLAQGDWDTGQHRVLDQRRNSQLMDGSERKRKDAAGEDPDFPPRHDWMAKLTGPAAYRVLEEFDRRWAMAGMGRLRRVPFRQVPRTGPLFVQTSHTYPIGFGGGDRQILAVYQRAISRARHYVYVENQYWTSEALTDALIARLRDNADLQVVIVLPGRAEDPGVGAVIGSEQWFQLSRLWAVAGTTRVRAYSLHKKHPSRSGYVNVYVHAKLAIVDDLWATIGSANTNNRSMIVDTECNAQIAHRPTVTAIRKAAWRELLDSTGGEADDAVAAIRDGFHVTGETNQGLMELDEELAGLIVPLRQPSELPRPPASIRPLL